MIADSRTNHTNYLFAQSTINQISYINVMLYWIFFQLVLLLLILYFSEADHTLFLMHLFFYFSVNSYWCLFKLSLDRPNSYNLFSNMGRMNG